jgi:hypothetical protein
MTSLAFDTHASVKKLKEAGFTEQQAEAQVQVLSQIIESNLATKLDIAEVKRDIETLRLATKADIVESKVDLIKWMAGLAIGAVIAMTGIFIAIIKAMVPGA